MLRRCGLGDHRDQARYIGNRAGNDAGKADFVSDLLRARQRGFSKAELARFSQPSLRMHDGTDGAGESDFTEIDTIGGQGRAGERGDQRSRRGEVSCGLVGAHSARNIEIDVVKR